MLADVWAGVRRDADARGVPERGVQLVTRLRARLDAVASRAGQQPSRPRVACLVGLDPPRPPGAWVEELVGWAGGEPSARARTRDPGRRHPRRLVDGERPGRGARARPAPCSRAPSWSRLRAAREGRVYVADGDAARGRPGPQVAESLEAFAEILHPAAFRFGHEGRTWARVDGAAPDGA